MSGLMQAYQHMVAGRPWLVLMALIIGAMIAGFTVHDYAQRQEQQDAAYQAGFTKWLAYCRRNNRQIDDCTSSWQRDSLLRGLFIEGKE